MSIALDEDYWSSRDGIYERLNMLGESIVYNYFNGAVKVSANAFGIEELQIVGPGPGDPGVCDYCAGLYDENGEGKVYKVWQFMPDLPAHIGCRHFFDVMIPDVTLP